MSVKKLDLTTEVLKLNLQAFPEHIESLTLLANLYIQQGDHARAEECLMKVLAVQPDNMETRGLLQKVHSL